MKAVSFVLLIFMLAIGVMPQNAKPVNTKKDCCHEMAGMGKNHSTQKQCGGVMCVTVLSCNNCCFLKTEQVKLKILIATSNQNNVTRYLAGNLSNYSTNCWNPPKV